ncbi:MAG: hypothetical protein WD512_16055 [Candidatus Paceibacterota bacterium]
MAGTFNANIVTRKLGLAEKHQNEVNLNLPNIEVKDQATKEAIDHLLKK